MKTALLFLLCFAPTLLYAADESRTDAVRKEADRLAKMLEKVADGGETGEQVAWVWNYYLTPILRDCEEAPIDARLEPTEKVLTTLLGKLADGPDGYKGFIGPYIYNKEWWCDAHVADAILFDHMLAFAMIVHEHPELRQKYGTSAARFVEAAKIHLIKKWNHRGTFIADGPFGGFCESKMFCKPGDTKHWSTLPTGRPDKTPSPSLPFNKAMDMAQCMLRIYRITGEPEYKTQAEKIFNRVKAGMNRFQGAYTWNYWEPVASSDILDKGKGKYDLSHWAATHPYRDYQEGEVAKIVFAYDMGVTFTESDIHRLIATNLQLMWNGNREKPEWANSDSKLPGYKKAPPSKAYPTTAGTSWSALGRFDATLFALATMGEKPKRLPPRDTTIDPFLRKYAPDAKVAEFPWWNGVDESKGQMLAVAIPTLIPRGEGTMLIAKACDEPSPLEIFIRPATGGKETLLTTMPLGHNVVKFYRWDGMIDGRRIPGDYVVLWKYRGGWRSWPVTVK